ncbi:MAG TPA: hypothetical protein VGY13_10290 [Solirubrobacteraceae bacterium]|jgi:hypothetical protein|nr:hypothetical protein [Solirubrobacteraceae bacterium]
MHDQPTPAQACDETQRTVLYLLTAENQPLWTVDDVGRAIDNRIGGVDAVGHLRRAGLIAQTTDGHVFATRAGYRAVAMTGAVV